MSVPDRFHPKPSSVSEAYEAAIDRMTGADKARRVSSLFCLARGALETRVRAEVGTQPEWRIALEVSRRMFLSDRGTQRLLNDWERAHAGPNAPGQ